MRFQDGVGETTCLSQKEECNRMYTLHYDSPLGGILLAADEAALDAACRKLLAQCAVPPNVSGMIPVLRAFSFLFPSGLRYRQIPAHGSGH